MCEMEKSNWFWRKQSVWDREVSVWGTAEGQIAVIKMGAD